MSYGDTDTRTKRSQNMKTGRDIFMGIFYAMLGGLIVYTKSFFNVPFPSIVAYLLGGMMLLGGLIRLYNGLKTFFPGQKPNN